MKSRLIYIFIVLILASFYTKKTYAHGADENLNGLTHYTADDDLYKEFIRKFPQIKIYQKSSITTEQKILIGHLMFKAVIDNYSPEFIEKTVAKAIIIHNSPTEYCAKYYPGRTDCRIAGWAQTNSGIMNIVVPEGHLVKSMKARTDLNAPCADDDSGCVTIKHYLSSQKSTIYHEFFHSIDTDPYSQAWQSITPARLTPTGKLDNTSFDPNLEGYVSKYAASSAVEDRAETFTHMLISPEQVLLKANTDSYVSAKLVHIKNYLKNICGSDESCKIPKQFEQISSSPSNAADTTEDDEE